MAMSVYSLRGRAKLVQICLHRPCSVASPSGSATVKGGSAAPHKNGKATNSVSDQTNPKKVFQQKQVF